MLSFLRKITFLLTIFLLSLMIYQWHFNQTAIAWKNHTKPQEASYLSLEEDQSILQELERQTEYSTYKVLDADFFSKPTIFNPIQ